MESVDIFCRPRFMDLFPRHNAIYLSPASASASAECSMTECSNQSNVFHPDMLVGLAGFSHLASPRLSSKSSCPRTPIPDQFYPGRNRRLEEKKGLEQPRKRIRCTMVSVSLFLGCQNAVCNICDIEHWRVFGHYRQNIRGISRSCISNCEVVMHHEQINCMVMGLHFSSMTPKPFISKMSFARKRFFTFAGH
jgi:hypothetical protein